METKTLIPATVMLIVFVANAINKPVNQMDIEQLVTASVTLVGVAWGIWTNHKKVPQQANQQLQPPTQP